MTNPTKIEVNCTTGEVLEIELTEEEIAEMAAEAQKFEASLKELEKQKEADAVAKQAILDRLGLTADEAALLLK